MSDFHLSKYCMHLPELAGGAPTAKGAAHTGFTRSEAPCPKSLGGCWGLARSGLMVPGLPLEVARAMR